MIEVEHLSRRYGDVTAVDDVSFRIGRGEVVGLLGHNGAGKTTVMKMMTGVLEPSAGRISIDGHDLETGLREIQRRIGYLPENCPVWPEMTVIDYLEFQATLHGVADARREAAVAAAVGRTALAERAGAPIHTLSRGYRQRVGVAQALLHEPAIVILDEPTNGLDPTQIRQMRDLIRDLARSATVIVSTHVLQEVQAVCERVLILRSGRLAVDARIEDLRTGGALEVTVGADARAVLQGVAGAGAVEDLPADGTLARYRLPAGAPAAPAVAAALAAAGIALYRLQPERQDLETVFARVNESSEAEAAHA
jgi:ABC-2 type transport system ATP-binding protein